MLKSKWSLWGLLLIAFLWQCSPAEDTSTTAQESIATSKLPEPTLTTFEVLRAEPSNNRTQLNLTGRLQALEQVQIVSEVAGRVVATPKLINEGVYFKGGSTLAKIDDQQFRLDLQSRKSQFQSALVRLMSQLQLDYPEAHAEWATYLANFSSDQLLQDLPEVKEEQLKYFLSANNVFSSFYTIKSAEELLPKYEIKAPFSGVISQGNLSVGALLSPGAPIATLQRSDVYELKASLSLANQSALKIGQEVLLRSNVSDQSWKGRVHRFGGAIDPSTQAIPVFIRVSGKGLKTGMFMEVNLDSELLENIVSLPLVALNRNNQVHQIQDSVVRLLSVKPMQYEAGRVWVTGLSGGEQIIIEPIDGPIVGTKALPKE